MEDTLTIRQAFDVMTDFLAAYWKKTDSDEVANLLSDMNTEIWADGSTADPAIWGEWCESVNKVIKTEIEGKLTAFQAFQAMVKFLEKYYELTKSDDIGILLGGMDQSFWNDRKTFDPAIWDDWIEAVDGALNAKDETP